MRDDDADLISVEIGRAGYRAAHPDAPLGVYEVTIPAEMITEGRLRVQLTLVDTPAAPLLESTRKSQAD